MRRSGQHGDKYVVTCSAVTVSEAGTVWSATLPRPRVVGPAVRTRKGSPAVGCPTITQSPTLSIPTLPLVDRS